jgi:hypothetical protein
MYVCIYVCMYVRMYVYYVCVCMYIRVYVCVYVRMYRCTRVYVCITLLSHAFPITSFSFPLQPHVTTPVPSMKNSTSSPGSNDEIFLSSKSAQNCSGALQTSY